MIAVSPAKLERLIGNLTPGGRHPRDILARRGNEASPTHVGRHGGDETISALSMASHACPVRFNTVARRSGSVSRLDKLDARI